jgi:hypothetical protein
VLLIAATAATSVGVSVAQSTVADAKPGIVVTFLQSPKKTSKGKSSIIPIRIANAWPVRALDVTLRLTAPAWVRLAGPSCAYHAAWLTCAVHSLAAGEGVTVRIQVTPLRLGHYRVIARASAKTAASTKSFVRSTRVLRSA